MAVVESGEEICDRSAAGGSGLNCSRELAGDFFGRSTGSEPGVPDWAKAVFACINNSDTADSAI